MKVSVDFDSTLSRKDVQEYAKELVNKGYEVWIVTSRFETVEQYNQEFLTKYGITDLVVEHEYLFKVADECGISRDHIVFTNMEHKNTYFINHPEFAWHLDDDFLELVFINQDTEVTGISVLSGAWKQKCERYLKMS